MCLLIRRGVISAPMEWARRHDQHEAISEREMDMGNAFSSHACRRAYLMDPLHVFAFARAETRVRISSLL